MTKTNGDEREKSGDGKVVLSGKEMWKILKRVLKFSSDEYLNLSLGTVSLFVNSLTNLYFPYAIGRVVDSASVNSGQLLASDLQGPSIFFITGAIASFVRVYNFGLVKENSANRLKSALMSNCLEQDVNFFDEVGTGELLTTLEKDVLVTADIFAEKIPSAIRSVNSALLGSVYLFRVSPYLCGVSLSTIPVVGIVAVALGKTSTRLTASLRELEKQQSVFVSERFRNISTVFVNGMQVEEKEAYNQFSQNILSQSKYKYFINGVKMSFINIATNASIIAVLYTGARMVSRQEITQGELTSFLMRSGFVGLGFSSMASGFSELRSSLAAASRVFTYVDAQKAVQSQQSVNKECASPSPPLTSSSSSSSDVVEEEDPMAMSCYVDLSPSSILSPSGQGSNASSPLSQLHKNSSASATSSAPPIVSFRNVTFAYRSHPQLSCLKGLTVDIFGRSMTAIAGTSGAGKSTMSALMCALYKPVTGSLNIAGHDVCACSDNDIKELRRKVAVVQQSSVLFSGTVAYNIGYGRPNATREDIEDAARMAFSHEFISGMVDGYDTEVGEGGSRLSGGQRQRIALSRALLHNPDILIMDEPSSSLDCENEDILINTLNSLKRAKCIIVLTHSPSIMAAADALHLLKDGAIVESGNFSTLKNLDSFKYVLQSASQSADHC